MSSVEDGSGSSRILKRNRICNTCRDVARAGACWGVLMFVTDVSVRIGEYALNVAHGEY